MVYSCLLVDDEREIVDYLYEMFRNIEEYELDVHKAYSGEEALRILDRFKIDVVISDIRMPGINGLQLVERIEKNWPECKIIFLTGHKEFDYIYKATRFKDIKYVLKISGDEELLEQFYKTILEIEERERSQSLIDGAQEKAELAQVILMKEYLSNVLLGLIMPSDITVNQLKEHKVSLAIDETLFLVVAKLGQFGEGIKVRSKEIIYNNLEGIVRRTLPKQLHYQQFFVENRFVAWFIQFPPHDFEEVHDAFYLIKGAFEAIQSRSDQMMEINISFAISHEAHTLSSLNDAYYKLKQTLNCFTGQQVQAILTDQSLMDHKNWLAENVHEDDGILSKKRSLSRIFEAYGLGARQKFYEEIEPFFDYLSSAKSMNSMEAIEIYLTMALEVLSYVNQHHMHESIAFRIPLYKLARIEYFEDWDDAVHYIKDFSEAIFDLIEEKEGLEEASIIEDIKKHIVRHLGEDLSLSSIADRVSLNASYLSRLFKQTTGMNISKYIKDKKIRRAKELLTTTNDKVLDISEQLGFVTAPYFTRFFKTEVGLSPQEYRHKHDEKFNL